jgi:hypothetical protein
MFCVKFRLHGAPGAMNRAPTEGLFQRENVSVFNGDKLDRSIDADVVPFLRFYPAHQPWPLIEIDNGKMIRDKAFELGRSYMDARMRVNLSCATHLHPDSGGYIKTGWTEINIIEVFLFASGTFPD